jgi:hypothetical protein
MSILSGGMTIVIERNPYPTAHGLIVSLRDGDRVVKQKPMSVEGIEEEDGITSYCPIERFIRAELLD